MKERNYITTLQNFYSRKAVDFRRKFWTLHFQNPLILREYWKKFVQWSQSYTLAILSYQRLPGSRNLFDFQKFGEKFQFFQEFREKLPKLVQRIVKYDEKNHPLANLKTPKVRENSKIS